MPFHEELATTPANRIGTPGHSLQRAFSPCYALTPAANCEAATSARTSRSAAGSIRYRDHGGDAVHRPARPLRQDAGRLRPRKRRRDAREVAGTLRTEDVVICVTGKVAHRPEGHDQSQARHRRDRGPRQAARAAQQVPQRRRFSPTAMELPGEDLRLKYRYLDLRRPEMQRTLMLRQRIIKAMRELLRRARLHRRRDADPRPQHAGRRPRLPGAQPRSQRAVLRPAAVAAALQADPDGRRLRPLRAGRPLLSRRGPAGRPPAGVHAARPGDVVRRRRRRDRHDRRPDGSGWPRRCWAST